MTRWSADYERQPAKISQCASYTVGDMSFVMEAHEERLCSGMYDASGRPTVDTVLRFPPDIRLPPPGFLKLDGMVRVRSSEVLSHDGRCFLFLRMRKRAYALLNSNAIHDFDTHVLVEIPQVHVWTNCYTKWSVSCGWRFVEKSTVWKPCNEWTPDSCPQLVVDYIDTRDEVAAWHPYSSLHVAHLFPTAIRDFASVFLPGPMKLLLLPLVPIAFLAWPFRARAAAKANRRHREREEARALDHRNQQRRLAELSKQLECNPLADYVSQDAEQCAEPDK